MLGRVNSLEPADAPADKLRQDLFSVMQEELSRMCGYKPAQRVDGMPRQIIDVLFSYRLILGRWPEFDTIEKFRAYGDQDLLGFTWSFLQSSEFKTRFPKDDGYDLSIMSELPDGMRMWFNWKDRQAVRIAIGVHEQSTQDSIRKVLRPGMHCIDIGAHVGLYTLVMAQGSKPGGKVFAFEPFPGTFDLLAKNIRENRLDEIVTAYEVACAAAPGEAQIFVPIDDDLGPTYVPAQTDESVAKGLKGLQVKLARVDDLVPEDIHIGLVKMDIEGGEPRALAGMERIVRRDRPFVVTEFNPYCLRHMNGTDPADYLRQLRNYGYTLYEDLEFQNNGKEYVYDGTEAGTNLACVPKS